jgi:copper homeostasis protein (lipoprotein)
MNFLNETKFGVYIWGYLQAMKIGNYLLNFILTIIINKPLCMKYSVQLFYLLCLLSLPNCKPAIKTSAGNSDNSRNSLDWSGMYYGVLPCADCEGIETTVQLNKDNTYTLSTKYAGKETTAKTVGGSFGWSVAGNIIILQNQQRGSFVVGENKLVQLDQDGKIITGELADRYILKKKIPGITEKYWKLTELNGKAISAAANFKKEPHMLLRADGNKVNGQAGCNSFMGTYELKNETEIHFSKIAATMMACPNMELEKEFLQVLEAADNYSIAEDKLVLNKARMAPLARFEAVYFK